ncbi:hypothetical protein A9Q88_10775 [Gammaproteobacteria bacterium 50_400_T64]|nr:hypothetical protein A9Q88_10775 [Gammaproteobacteria bacterium 50_400_T64]
MNLFNADLMELFIAASLLVLTLCAYFTGLWAFQKAQHFSLLHPLMSSCLLIAALLYSFDIDYTRYQQANSAFYWLLGPATIALAIPLNREFERIRALAQPLLMTLLFGAIAAPLCAVTLAYLFGAEPLTLLSLTPKSVTTPIALGIAKEIGALGELSAGVVIFTGVVGAIAGPKLLSLIGVKDERLQGFTLGINAHGVGTARAFDISPLCGAFSSLALGLTGVLTALTLPTLLLWLEKAF